MEIESHPVVENKEAIQGLAAPEEVGDAADAVEAAVEGGDVQELKNGEDVETGVEDESENVAKEERPVSAAEVVPSEGVAEVEPEGGQDHLVAAATEVVPSQGVAEVELEGGQDHLAAATEAVPSEGVTEVEPEGAQDQPVAAIDDADQTKLEEKEGATDGLAIAAAADEAAEEGSKVINDEETAATEVADHVVETVKETESAGDEIVEGDSEVTEVENNSIPAEGDKLDDHPAATAEEESSEAAEKAEEELKDEISKEDATQATEGDESALKGDETLDDSAVAAVVAAAITAITGEEASATVAASDAVDAAPAAASDTENPSETGETTDIQTKNTDADLGGNEDVQKASDDAAATAATVDAKKLSPRSPSSILSKLKHSISKVKKAISRKPPPSSKPTSAITDDGSGDTKATE